MKEPVNLKVYLRAFEPGDLLLLNEWHNDEEINLLTGGKKIFVSSAYDSKWIEDKMLNNTTQLYVAICETETKKMVGYTSLTNIDYNNRKAFMQGLVIGDKASRSKGYATVAAILLLNHAFYQLGLNKVAGTVMTTHASVIFTFTMLGFKKEGVLRQEVYKDNRYHDMLMLSLLKDDYEKKQF